MRCSTCPRMSRKPANYLKRALALLHRAVRVLVFLPRELHKTPLLPNIHSGDLATQFGAPARQPASQWPDWELALEHSPLPLEWPGNAPQRACAIFATRLAGRGRTIAGAALSFSDPTRSRYIPAVYPLYIRCMSAVSGNREGIGRTCRGNRTASGRLRFMRTPRQTPATHHSFATHGMSPVYSLGCFAWSLRQCCLRISWRKGARLPV